jgi:hypothetical protein
MSLVENYDWIPEEQKAKWKAEGHWPPTIFIHNENLPFTEEIVNQGIKREDQGKEKGEHFMVVEGRLMQDHPKSWRLRLQYQISKPQNQKMLKKLIEMADSE